MAFRLVNRERLMAPRKCLICESKPTHRVVDTGYSLTAATVLDKLRGRKYVCESCGEKVGKALGMANQGTVNTLKEQVIDLENQLAEAKEQGDLKQSLDAAIAYITKTNGHTDVVPPPSES
jgi:hypothetical protein